MTVHVITIRIAAIATVIGVSASAFAQSAPNPWGLKLGITFPTNKDVRDVVAKNGINVGASYGLNIKPLLKGKGATMVSADLDFFRLGSGSNNIELINLGYTEKISFEESESGTGAYAGFTAGLGLTKLKATSTVQNTQPPTEIGPPQSGGGTTTFTKQKIQPFLELLVGYKVQKNIGIEAFYRVMPKTESVDTNIFGVRIGYKF